MPVSTYVDDEKLPLAQQAIEEKSEEKLSWWNKIEKWVGLGISILGLTAGIILAFVPLTTPFGVFVTGGSVAGLAWSVRGIRKRYQEERARDH